MPTMVTDSADCLVKHFTGAKFVLIKCISTLFFYYQFLSFKVSYYAFYSVKFYRLKLKFEFQSPFFRFQKQEK